MLDRKNSNGTSFVLKIFIEIIILSNKKTIAFLREGVTQCSCCQTAGCQKKANPVVAIVGPAKSSTTIAVQNLLQVFRIPQIGYAATTTDLSDKEQFGYYLRYYFETKQLTDI